MQLLIDGQAVGDAPAEIVEWQQVELACLPPTGATLTLELGGVALEPFLRPGDPAWRWRWNPQGGVGLYALRLTARCPDADDRYVAAQLRVLPRKVDQQHYAALLADVQRAARALAYRLGAAAERGLLDSEPAPPSPLESYYAFLDAGIAQLERVVAQIARHPHEQLRPQTAEVPLEEARAIAPDALASLQRQSMSRAPADLLPTLQEQLRPGGGALPRAVPEHQSAPSYDTYENRLLRHVLGLLAARLRAYLAQVERERGRLERNAAYVEAERGRLTGVVALAERCTACAARLRSLQAQPFLAQVGRLRESHGPTAAVQRDPRYRAVYRLWQELRRQPLLDPASDLFSLPIHDLPRLYESWCALRVAEALLALPGASLVAQHLLAEAGQQDAASLALPEDRPLLTVALGDTTLALRYHPRYRPAAGAGSRARGTDMGSLDRHTRVPDLAIERRRPQTSAVVWLLDAKYRLDAGGGVPQQALDDAYTYLGSLGYADGTRAAAGALLLYPGRGRPERYASGVGALPLLPGHDDGLAILLAEIASHG